MRKPIVSWLLAGALLLPFAGPARAQSLAERVSVHGFITQAFADSRDYSLFGISQDGTADIRSAALQGRFSVTRGSQLVVQLSHRRLGSSALAELEEDVELDWAFAQQRFLSTGTSIRAGRVPMPRGLFNEIRDVGTLLPFYRASKAFYSEGVETVDGVVLGQRVELGDWGLESSAFYGNFDIKVTATLESGRVAVQNDMENAYGGQLIVNTPVWGLRFGGTWLHSDYAGASNSDSDEFTITTASVDGSFEDWYARAEYELANSENSVDYEAWYGQAGLRVWRDLWVNGQAEWNVNTLLAPAPVAGYEIDAIRDYALGLSYKLRPNLVLKLEAHDFEGFEVDDVLLDPFGAPVGDTYLMFSVSAAF